MSYTCVWQVKNVCCERGKKGNNNRKNWSQWQQPHCFFCRNHSQWASVVALFQFTAGQHEKKYYYKKTQSYTSFSGILARWYITSNLWLLTFLPFLFQTILGCGSPVAWHTKEATPPWTPVWSSGVRVNLGGAVWKDVYKSQVQTPSVAFSGCVCVCVCAHVNQQLRKIFSNGLLCFSKCT